MDATDKRLDKVDTKLDAVDDKLEYNRRVVDILRGDVAKMQENVNDDLGKLRESLHALANKIGGIASVLERMLKNPGDGPTGSASD